jgi:hypothetical protein
LKCSTVGFLSEGKVIRKCITHVSGGVHDELALDGPHPVLLVLRVQLVAGEHEGVHVADGAACVGGGDLGDVALVVVVDRVCSPGAKMLSPVWNPMISLILARQAFSMRMKTGAIS